MPNLYGNICTCTRCNGIVHTIRRGDTLYLLSRHYNVSVNDIMNANRNINIYNLRIGDDICIPVRRTMTEIMDNVREDLVENIHENIQEEIREEINEEIREDMREDMRDNVREEMREDMRRETMEVSMMTDSMNMKLRDVLDKDMTFGEFVKILKENS